MSRSKLKNTLEILAASFIVSIEVFLSIFFIFMFVMRGKAEYAVVGFSLLLLFTYPTLSLIKENQSRVCGENSAED